MKKLRQFDQIKDLDDIIRETKIIVAGDSNNRSQDEDNKDKEDAVEKEETLDSDGYDVWEDIQFNTQCLAEIRPSLEQNLASMAETRARDQSQPHVQFCLSDPADFYVARVREKYQQAPRQLVERLGEANWQRHIAVRKRMERINDTSGEDAEPAYSEFRPYSAFHDSGLGASLHTQSQYAASAASHTSFLSDKSGGEQGALQVPPTPAEVSAGKPFECFLCGDLQTKVRNRVEWKLVISSILTWRLIADNSLECTFLQTYGHTSAPLKAVRMS